MLFDGTFKEFIKSTVPSNPTAKNPVDVFGEFKVEFRECTGNFSDTGALAEIINTSTIPDISTSTFYNHDFHGLLKNINDVELNVNEKNMDLPGVSYALHRLMPMNSSPNIILTWLNTTTPYIEKIFVPWMTENTINNAFPMLKADMVISFPMLSFSGQSIEYWYYGIRPIECGLHRMTNEPITDFYRKVKLDFDYFYIYPNGR